MFYVLWYVHTISKLYTDIRLNHSELGLEDVLQTKTMHLYTQVSLQGSEPFGCQE